MTPKEQTTPPSAAECKAQAQTSSRRAEANRKNAQHSTGPRTPEGKLRSSQNSFRHGLYSEQLVIPGEDPAEFDHLRATLRDEHQPADTTEEILIDELAQHFWRLRRFRRLEASAWTPGNLSNSIDTGLLALVQRSMASAERSFHRALAALTKLQKQRGFVPAKAKPAQAQSTPDGFVPGFHFEEVEEDDKHPHIALHTPQCHSQNIKHDAPVGFVPAIRHEEDSPPVAA